MNDGAFDEARARRAFGSDRLARRLESIPPFHVMEVQERAFALESAGRRIIHMEIGQPDFGAPEPVLEAARQAMACSPLGYTSALGLPALREAISAFYRTRHQAQVPAARIGITTGASSAFVLALAALVEPGDEVLMPDPCYPCSRHMVSLYGAQPRALPVGPSTAYQPTASQVIEAWSPSTRGVMLASPANPTGTRIDARELAAIAAAVRERGGFLIVDEIYLGLTHGDEAGGSLASAVSLGEDIIVTNSFSKYFSMTGWRLGWIVAPTGLMREIEKLAQNLYVSPPTLSQHAALAAFDPRSLAILEERRREFGARRDLLVPALRAMGFGIPIVPDGAFYVYAGCGRFGRDASTLARELLETAGVAITPGKDFGEHGATRHVRFAYTRSQEEIAEGIERMRRALAGGA